MRTNTLQRRQGGGHCEPRRGACLESAIVTSRTSRYFPLLSVTYLDLSTNARSSCSSVRIAATSAAVAHSIGCDATFAAAGGDAVTCAAVGAALAGGRTGETAGAETVGDETAGGAAAGGGRGSWVGPPLALLGTALGGAFARACASGEG